MDRNSHPLLCVAVLAAAIIFVVSFAQMFNRTFRGADDELYFYRLSLGMFHAQEVQPLYEKVSDHLAQQHNDIALKRWKLQVQYANNYVMMNAVIHTTSRALRHFITSVQTPYPLFVTASIAIGVIVNSVFALLCVLLIVLLIGDFRIATGLSLGFASAALCSLLQPSHLANFFGPVTWAVIDDPVQHQAHSINPTDIALSIVGLAKTFLAAGHEYSIFGYPPRNQFYLLGLGVFLLRWREYWFSSYVLAIATSLVHQSAATLMLMIFLSIDVTLRPTIFDRKLVVLCAIGLALQMWRETLFTSLSLWPALIAGVIVLAALTVMYRPVERRILAPIRKTVLPLGIIATDLAAGFLIFLLLVPLSVVMNRIADPYTALVFWAWLPVRVLMMFQPAYFVGLAVLILGWIESRMFNGKRGLYVAAISLALGATVPLTYVAIETAPQLGRAAFMIGRVSQLAGWPLQRGIDVQTREAAFHYAISLQIDSGKDVLTPMLGRN